MTSAPDTHRPLPRTVWALGIVSLLMDASSETIHALLPLFLTTTLGASVALVGLIDGIAEATAAIAKVFSGYVSDRIGRRKPLILLGYGLGALSKPLFPLAASAGLVFGARFIDRIGKGLRGAPRDALVADVTPLDQRGRAYGLRQALDTVGAFIGPLAAIVLMQLYAGDMRTVFWFAAIPAALAVLCVLFGVEDADHTPAHKPAALPMRRADLKALGARYWRVVALGVVFTLARFSEAFLILKAHASGLPLALAPLVLVTMNIVYALAAYPAGALSDRLHARGLLLTSLAALLVADVTLALGDGLVFVFSGIALWGLHMALSQGLLAKLVAEQAPVALRGSAFGLFNLTSGVAMLLASVLAGALWQSFGAATTFWAGALFALVAALLVQWLDTGPVSASP
ncbi:MAG: MFS transporter [Gammaproteobacteria bacterium]|nr:MFS transporter [Gammaproteobacteria bacterium]